MAGLFSGCLSWKLYPVGKRRLARLISGVNRRARSFENVTKRNRPPLRLDAGVFLIRECQ